MIGSSAQHVFSAEEMASFRCKLRASLRSLLGDSE